MVVLDDRSDVDGHVFLLPPLGTEEEQSTDVDIVVEVVDNPDTMMEPQKFQGIVGCYILIDGSCRMVGDRSSMEIL